MPYTGEARIRYGGPPQLCAPYIRAARVIAERVVAMFDVPNSAEAATRTVTLDDGAVVRVTVFEDVPPIITITPPKEEQELGADRYRRCYNGLVVDYTEPNSDPLPAGKGWLKLPDEFGLLPVDDITGFVDWDAPEVGQRVWPLPLDSQMSVQYRPGLIEPHYLSGSGAQLCDRTSEWYWVAENVVWRVEARTTEPAVLAAAEPELTELNTRKMPLDYQAADIPNKLNDAPVAPDNETEPSYQLGQDVVYHVRKMTEIVERDKWKVGLFLTEVPIRTIGNVAMPERRQRTVWVKFTGPTRSERYTSRGQTDSTPVWGHLRLHEVTEAGALFTVVGTIAFVGESNGQHIVRGYGASDRGTVLLRPDLTYTVTENPNPIYDTEQDNRTAIPNTGQTIPVVRFVSNRETVQTSTSPDRFETTDTMSATIEYEDPAPLDPYGLKEGWQIPNRVESNLWRLTVVPKHTAQGTNKLYDTQFSWGIVRVTEDWSFTYERTTELPEDLPTLTLSASATAVHGDDIQDEVTASSVTGNGEGIIDMVADQQLTATYTITVGAQVFTLPFSAVHKTTDEMGWAFGADPADVGPITSLGSSLISFGARISQNGYGDYVGPRKWDLSLSLDGEAYSFYFEDTNMSSPLTWEKYTNNQDFAPRYSLVDSDRTTRFTIPWAMTEFMKQKVGETYSYVVGDPTPQRVFRAMPVVSTVARPGLLYVKFTFPQFEYNAPAFSVDYVFTAAGHKVMMHPNNEIASSNEDGIIFYDHLTLQEPLDKQTAANASALPIDACYNPQTQQLYVRYANDPPGCFVQMADVGKTLYKVKEGEELPDDIIIKRTV